MTLRSVVLINSFCHVEGGASRVAIDEATGLARLNLSVTFIGAVGPVSRELAAERIRTICLNQQQLKDDSSNPWVALQGLWNLEAYRAVSRVLRELDPRETVVHLHGFTQGLSSSPVRCALQHGFKVVCTLHEYFAACPNGGFFDFPSASACQRRPLSAQCVMANCDKRRYLHKAYRVLRTGVQRTIGKLPGGVLHYVALSQRSADILRPYLPKEAKIHFVENPVDVPQYRPVDVARNQLVVAIGRLDPEKGIAQLIRAAELAGNRVLFIGDGPLRPLVERSASCRVTGWLSRSQVLEQLEAARCLAFPSLWYETFGLSVAEAAARGVPAIVSAGTGAAERVRHGVTGWSVPMGDVQALAGSLRGIRDDKIVSAAGKAAFAGFWQAPASLERHTAELLKVYDAVLDD